ncbi:MAG: hypothetical protein U0892_17100 [Pirellulales bacterium]
MNKLSGKSRTLAPNIRLEEHVRSLRAEFSADRRDQLVTDWDEARHAAWDDAERRALRLQHEAQILERQSARSDAKQCRTKMSQQKLRIESATSNAASYARRTKPFSRNDSARSLQVLHQEIVVFEQEMSTFFQARNLHDGCRSSGRTKAILGNGNRCGQCIASCARRGSAHPAGDDVEQAG